MRDTMQSALQRPDLSVWERTYLPTTSSKIKALLNGKYGETSFASRHSEAGGTGYHVTRLPGGETALIGLSSSHPEVSWSSYHDTQKSSPPMRCPSYTSEWMGLQGNLALVSEVTPDESTSDEWPQIPSISDTILKRLVFGNSPQISSWIASTIRRITNSLLDSGK
jgi:hypothetical protein|uniref:Uncharacterized protein n=1 Tax=Siphoviridae sp. ctSdk10 TaxID=2826345 RepID=A0A8S5MKU3_9CAUD|nr:MAG TPA: hypothetical protein [Siphoviridae sp. ctSdk10]